jgi:hypothetical protein
MEPNYNFYALAHFETISHIAVNRNVIDTKVAVGDDNSEKNVRL